MEHRFNHRHQVVRQVTLRYRNKCIASCQVRNLGRGGVFVEVPENTDIPLGALVRLVWQVSPDNQQHVDGLVVHQTPQGFGLMFHDEHAANLLIDDQVVSQTVASDLGSSLQP